MEIKKHSDQKYIEALLNNNSNVLQELYQKFSPKVMAYITKNSGNFDEAQDVIQETLVTIYKQAKEKGLVLNVPFDAYFFLLCKRRWLNELKKKGRNQVTNIEEDLSISDKTHEMVDETELYEARNRLFKQKFQLLSKSCQELLEKAFNIKSMQKVAEILGVSYAYARKKKSQCIGKLTEIVKASSTYQQLKTL